MDKESVVNKVIKDNYKIRENESLEKDMIEHNIKDSEKSFNQLLNLQLLIQKHSGLKELCKLILNLIFIIIILVIKERDDAHSKINEELQKIWKLKLLAEKKNYIISSIDDFEINKVFISSFLNGLWKAPEAMYNIIINSDIKIVESNLAPFIVNNFYCNYLSGNYMDK